MPRMTPEQRDDFLKQTRIAKLVTLYPDGSPAVVPVWYEWDGKHAWVFTGRESEKVARISADPRVALSVEEPVGVPEAWVAIEGAASVEQQGAIDLAKRLAQRYYDSEKAARAIEQWERFADRLVVLKITPRRIRSSAPG
jgi:PPOX class probable F420-dependent enzyme